MKLPRSPLAAFCVALAIFTLGTLPDAARSERAPAPRGTAQAEDPLDARVIVKYKSDSTLMRSLSVRGETTVRPLHAATLSQRMRIPLSDGRMLGQRTQGLRGAGLTSSKLAEQLASLPEVEWAVVDQRRRIRALTNDPLLADNQPVLTTPTAGQWYLRAPSALFVSAINAVKAWDLTPGSPAITVAVLDTGILSAHPDLAGKLQPNGLGGYGYDFVRDIPTANDGDGRDASSEDPGDGTTLSECSPGEAPESSSWHGTKVAGLIGAATDNGIGMASVGRNIMLLPVRVLGRCGGYDSDIIAAMRWAAGLTSDVGSVTPLTNTHPAKVINLSLGATGACPASYRDVVAEVNAAGVSVVAAAGNENGLTVDAPANCAGVVAVAGVRHVGTKVGYSNVGPEVTISAPAGNCGNSISCLYPLLTISNAGSAGPLTTPTAYIYTDGSNVTGSPTYASFGTSFSAPLVSGTVGLMLSLNPSLTPAGVKSILQSSARAFPTSGGEAAATACHAPNGSSQIECYCTTSTCGAGMLDTAGAVAHAFDPTAAATSSNASPTVGSVITLDGGGSLAYGGRTLTTYKWSIVSGASSASFSGGNSNASVALNALATGNVTVQLLVADNTGATATTTTTFTIAPVPVIAAGGGGGALDWTWLLGIAAALASALLSSHHKNTVRLRRIG
jgi:serine protease